MLCSKETLARFFYNFSSLSFLLLLFIYYSSISLAKFFHFVGSYPLIQRYIFYNHHEYLLSVALLHYCIIFIFKFCCRTQNEYDYNLLSEEEEEEEEVYGNDRYFRGESTEKDRHHLVADIIRGGESLVFLHDNSLYGDQDNVQEFINPPDEHVTADDDRDESFDTAQYSEPDDDGDSSDAIVDEGITPARDNDHSAYHSEQNHGGCTSPIIINVHNKSDLVENDDGTFTFLLASLCLFFFGLLH